MTEPFIGQISMYAFNFAPRGWAICGGQTMLINQNAALFALLGTTYGGNGTTNFLLPNLLGRVPIHFGQGPGLSNYSQGQSGGQETVTLSSGQMPSHNHPWKAATSGANGNQPGGNQVATGTVPMYGPATALTPMNGGVIGPAGGSQPHSNLAPYLAVNFCIALQGIFPSRN